MHPDWLRPPFLDRREYVGNNFVARLCAEIAFAVNAETDGVRFHITVADDESRIGGMHFHLFGVRDLGFDVVVAGVQLATDLVSAPARPGWRAHNRGAELHRRWEGCGPARERAKGEVAGVMVDEAAS